MRYWCVVHRASATGKMGIRMPKCECADRPSILPSQALELHPAAYRGGVAVWGAVPPVYSTATHDEPEIGVHVHARRLPRKKKLIDFTYKLVRIYYTAANGEDKLIEVCEADAIHFLIASVFQLNLSFVEYSYCNIPHLDEGFFSVHPHKKHLCYGCGREFTVKQAGIGNPLVAVRSLFQTDGVARATAPAKRTLDIRQADFPLGIELWGSNPAILWTSPAPEEHGIHFHGYTNNFVVPTVDETFDDVIIDGAALDADQLRVFMAQLALGHLNDRIVSLTCPRCDLPHFDRERLAYTPHDLHLCDCGAEFPTPGRRKKVVSNPMVELLNSLERSSVSSRRYFRDAMSQYSGAMPI